MIFSPERLGGQREGRRLDFSAAAQGRGREGQAVVVGQDGDQTRTALLDHGPVPAQCAAGRQPGACRAQGGVPGERQLLLRGEDPHAVIGPLVIRRQQEGSLGEVGPARELGHLLIGELGGVVHDGQRIAPVRHRGEDIDLGEAEIDHGRESGTGLGRHNGPAGSW